MFNFYYQSGSSSYYYDKSESDESASKSSYNYYDYYLWLFITRRIADKAPERLIIYCYYLYKVEKN